MDFLRLYYTTHLGAMVDEGVFDHYIWPLHFARQATLRKIPRLCRGMLIHFQWLSLRTTWIGIPDKSRRLWLPPAASSPEPHQTPWCFLAENRWNSSVPGFVFYARSWQINPCLTAPAIPAAEESPRKGQRSSCRFPSGRSASAAVLSFLLQVSQSARGCGL